MKEFLTVLGATSLLFGGIAVGINLMLAAGCHQTAEMMKLESDYGMLTGCMVKVDDRWFPTDMVRYVNGQLIVEGDAE